MQRLSRQGRVKSTLSIAAGSDICYNSASLANHLNEDCVNRTNRIYIVLLVLALTICADQAVKVIAQQNLANRPPVSLLGGIVVLTYAENPGAFLSLGASLPAAARTAIFGVFVAAVLVALLVFLFGRHPLSTAQLIGLSLLAGGGVGNLIDRLARGGLVRDYVHMGIGPLRTGVFNVADLAIVGGVILVALTAAQGDEQATASGDHE
jgi:signal peptidase II